MEYMITYEEVACLNQCRDLSRMIVLQEGLRRRLYLKEVTGRGPGPRQRGGAVAARWRTEEVGRRLTDGSNLKPDSPSLKLGLYNATQTDSNTISN